MRAILLLILIIPIFIYANILGQKQQDIQSETLCREYASRSHEKEFAPERYAKLKDEIDNYNWYDACIENINHPLGYN